MSIHEQARAAVLEADEYMANHRVTDSWRVISRLHGALVRLADEATTRTRVVTTVTELDALPVGSVVLSEQGAVFEHDHDGFWAEPGFTWRPMSKDMALPARVLYNPEEDA